MTRLSHRTALKHRLPPLESGDRLTREEFERRYTADDRAIKAELIEGIVYVASPLRFPLHSEPHSRLNTGLGTYAAFTPGTRSGIEPTVRLDRANEVQPDIALMLDETAGGNARITEDGYLEGAPELVVEIAASSAAIDLNRKLQVYRRHGVLEYIVWQSYEQRLDWFVLDGGQYHPLTPDDDRVLRSRVFPGLWLAIDAFSGDRMTEVLEVLQQGMRSSEYLKFKEAIG